MGSKVFCYVFFSLILTESNKVIAKEDIPDEDGWRRTLELRYPVFPPPPVRGSPGEPLFLTPFLEKGEIEKARNLSLVDTEHLIEGIESYAGYITVDKKYNSNLWFWFFPAEESDVADVPLVLWLQGGPGASSLFGLFEELGPFSVDEKGTYLLENPHSWHKNHSLLFIDNPVGTGFSFTDSDEGYRTNQTQIGEDLYVFMDQFLRIYTELQNVPLYITGESYAGKHIPSLAYQIHKNNPTADMKINLEGLAIGNGFIDPATMMVYSDFVYQLGLADDALRNKMKDYENGAVNALEKGDTWKAYKYFSAALGTFLHVSEINSIYNYAYEKSMPLYGPFTEFIQTSDVRRALHVGNTKFKGFGKVYEKLRHDFMGSAKSWLEELSENYKVLSYSGQNDIICAYPLSVQTYRSMHWKGSKQYLEAERKPWYFGKVLAGYVKISGNFQEILVRNAGHMVPTDQPARALELLSSFVRNIPLPFSAEDDDDEDEEIKQN